MDTNDKVKMTIIGRDDETNEVKIRLDMAYGIKSFEKEVK
nr:MAG TPA: hypothetical protein [Caudoviricetes sp.]